MNNSLKQKELESKARVESEEIFRGKVYNLRRDTLIFDHQAPHVWDLILHPGAVAVIPINEKGNLLLIKQWRRAIEKIIFELCAGTLEKG